MGVITSYHGQSHTHSSYHRQSHTHSSYHRQSHIHSSQYIFNQRVISSKLRLVQSQVHQNQSDVFCCFSTFTSTIKVCFIYWTGHNLTLFSTVLTNILWCRLATWFITSRHRQNQPNSHNVNTKACQKSDWSHIYDHLYYEWERCEDGCIFLILNVMITAWTNEIIMYH